jgi:cyclase
MGDILDLTQRYADEGVDELVFYDITASSDGRVVEKSWVNQIARRINIPFCVAGGIRSIEDAKTILNDGADKISINSPALERPEFISELAAIFGTQCIVAGIDSRRVNDKLQVYQYTGDATKTIKSKRDTVSWAQEVTRLGAGEIVLNCMNNDGVGQGYDIEQLIEVRAAVRVPIIASGGAGDYAHFADLFRQTNIDGALAASVFHSGKIPIPTLKTYLKAESIEVRI